MAKIEAVRNALVADDTAAIKEVTSAQPKCVGSPSCLNEIANALGSTKGFVIDPPDHAAAATAAVILVRDERGDYLEKVDMWLTDMKNETGVGHDALRLAVARKMAEAAPLVGGGKKIEDDTSARAVMKAIAAAIPGACKTYALLGDPNTDPKSIAPEHGADNSACVQKDLSRREGPGGRYGSGTFRALEGALSIWRETERALRMGLGHCDPGPRATIEKKLSLIEPATRKIETRKVESDSSSLNFMSGIHAEAGVVLLRQPKDAGHD